MGRLGDHPHVLSIHELGEDDRQPYMVLPLMTGGEAEALLEKAEAHRLPLEQDIDLGAQICRRFVGKSTVADAMRHCLPGNLPVPSVEWRTGGDGPTEAPR